MNRACCTLLVLSLSAGSLATKAEEEGSNGLDPGDAATELISSFENFIKDTQELEKLPTDEEKLYYILDKGRERIQEKACEKMQDAAKEKLTEYAGKQIRLKMFLAEFPAVAAAGRLSGRTAAQIWEEVDGRIASRVEIRTKAFGAALEVAEVGWDAYEEWSKNGTAAGLQKLGEGLCDKAMESVVPGWAQFRAAQAVVNAMGDYIMSYAFNTALEAKISGMYPDIKGNPEAFARWIMDKTPANLKASVDDQWELVEYGKEMYPGKGHDKGTEAMKGAILDALLSMRGNILVEKRLRENEQKELAAQLEELQRSIRQSEQELRELSRQALAQAEPLLKKIDDYRKQNRKAVTPKAKAVTPKAKAVTPKAKAETPKAKAEIKGTQTVNPTQWRNFSDLNTNEVQQLLDCLCSVSPGRGSGSTANFYCPTPLPNSPSCADPANGPCVMQGFGCHRFWIALTGKEAQSCLAAFRLTNDAATIAGIIRHTVTNTTPVTNGIVADKKVVCPGEPVTFTFQQSGGVPPYRANIWLGSSDPNLYGEHQCPEFLDTDGKWKEWTRSYYGHPRGVHLDEGGKWSVVRTDDEYWQHEAVHSNKLMAIPVSSITVRFHNPREAEAGGINYLIGDSLSALGIPGLYDKLGMADPHGFTLASYSFSKLVTVLSEEECKKKDAEVNEPPEDETTSDETTTEDGPEKDKNKKKHIHQPPVTQPPVTPVTPPVTPVPPPVTPPVTQSTPPVTQPPVTLITPPATPPAAQPPASKPPVKTTSTTHPPDGGEPTASPGPSTTTGGVDRRQASDGCDECLKMGGGAEGVGYGSTDASGKTTEGSQASASYFVEGCPGQKVRIVVQGSDGWSGSAEGENQRAEVARPVGTERGTDTITVENLSIPGCSRTFEVPFGPQEGKSAEKGGPSDSQPPVSQEDLTYVKGFAGKWSSNWGDMELAVNGAKVTGQYTHDQGRIEATLSADGKTMVGVWLEAPAYKPPRDGGNVTFELLPDGDHLQGKWGYGDNLNEGNWTGTRIKDVSIKAPGTGTQAGGTATPGTTATKVGDGALAQFAWVGADADMVGTWNTANPDGQTDGHFRVMLVGLAPNTEVRSMNIYVCNASGNRGGSFWRTEAGSSYILGAFHNGTFVNPDRKVPLGFYSGDVSFDLYASNDGSQREGALFMLEVDVAGTKLSRMTSIMIPFEKRRE